VIRDKVVETDCKYFDVNEHCQQMNNIMMETTQVTCGLSENPCGHKETWQWNEEVAEALKEKKKVYGNWKKEKSTET